LHTYIEETVPVQAKMEYGDGGEPRFEFEIAIYGS
jgi:hypothetical protein